MAAAEAGTMAAEVLGEGDESAGREAPSEGAAAVEGEAVEVAAVRQELERGTAGSEGELLAAFGRKVMCMLTRMGD